VIPTAHLPLHCCDGSPWAWEDEPVPNTQAMVPEPNDDPKPYDESDGQRYGDEPEPRRDVLRGG